MSTTRRVSDPFARGARTAVQAVPAGVIVEFIDAVIVDMNDRQYAAVLALLFVIIAFVQAAVENGIGKALFRDVTPPANPPVVDNQNGG